MSQAKLQIVIEALNMAKGELERLEQELGGVQNKAQAAGPALGGIKSGLKAIAGVVGTVTAGVFAFKKALDFAEEGAQLELTEERFNRLAVSIGTTGEALLRDLEPAMGGMLSRAEMMQAATDLMSLGLVKTHDEAIRLARVAGQLNMNMSQLVLTLTNQTTMRFDALGLSVDGFKEKIEELKAAGMDADAAFKEAFLQQAEAQLERVGSAAETSAGEIARFKATWKNMADEAKTGVTNAMMPLIRSFNDAAEETARWKEALDAGIISAEEYNDIQWKIIDGVMTDAEAQAFLAARVQEYNDRLQESMVSAEAADQVLMQYAKRQMQVGEAASTSAGGISGVASALDRIADASGRALPEINSVLDTLNRNVGSPIAAFVEDLEWYMATGGRIEAAFENIKSAFMAGQLTPEEAQALAGQLLVVYHDVATELGNEDMTSAAEKLAEALNIPKGVAEGMLQTTQNLPDAMAALDDVEFQIESLEVSDATASHMLSVMNALTGRTWVIQTEMTTVPGGGPAFPSPGFSLPTPVGPPKPPRQVIPGRHSQDIFRRAHGGPLTGVNLVGEDGPELVIGDTVIPSALTRQLMTGLQSRSDTERFSALVTRSDGGADMREFAQSIKAQVAAQHQQAMAMARRIDYALARIPTADDISRAMRDAVERVVA